MRIRLMPLTAIFFVSLLLILTACSSASLSTNPSPQAEALPSPLHTQEKPIQVPERILSPIQDKYNVSVFLNKPATAKFQAEVNKAFDTGYVQELTWYVNPQLDYYLQLQIKEYPTIIVTDQKGIVLRTTEVAKLFAFLEKKSSS